MRSFTTLVASASIVLAGCGGGGSGAEEPGAAETSIGSLSVSGKMAQSPLVTTAGATTITGVVGSFSLVRIKDLEPVLPETQYAVAASKGIVAYDWDGSHPRILKAPTSGELKWLQFHAQTNRVYYVDGNSAYSIGAAGGSPKLLMTRNGLSSYEVSPDGQKVALETDWQYAVQIANLDGSSPHYVSDYGRNPAWIDNNRLVYEDSGHLIAYNWKTLARTTFNDASVRACTSPSVSPDGKRVAAIWLSTTKRLAIFSIVNGVPVASSFFDAGDLPTGTIDLGWTSDSGRVVCSTQSGSVHLVNPASASDSTLLHQTSGSRTMPFLAAQPFILSRLLIGSGGSLGTSAGGIILSERGADICSFAVLDANTRYTGKLTREAADSSALNTVLRYEADAIKNISYTVDRSYVPVNILAPTAGANGALISFDKASGRIVSLLYYNVSRGGSAPTVIERGRSLVIQGEWLAAYDGAGRAIDSGEELTLDGLAVR